MTLSLDPRLFGHPASRPRLYLLLFSRAHLESLGLSDDEVYNMTTSIMTKFCHHGLASADDFLLPDSSPLIKSFLENPPADPHDCEQLAGNPVEPPPDARWPTQHFDKLGSAWWRPQPITADMVEKFPGLRFLSDRTRDYLASSGVVFPEAKTRYVELSQSADRARFFKSSIGCVTPRSFRWVTTKMRPTHGAEHLLCQGLFFDEDKLSEFSSSALSDLAGNAFHAGCVLAATMCHIVVLGIGMARFSARRPCQLADANDDIDADLEVDDLDQLLSFWH